MEEKIYEICKDLESKENIKILFAVENGSRAWRFDSRDSDFDVRFVFVRPLKEYIQIKKPSNVITISFDERGEPCSTENAFIDVCGFDVFKFVELLSRSNPTTIEWLMSDIVYYGEQNEVFKNFALENFSKIALYYHYKSLCRDNYQKYLKPGKQVTYKRYLYTLRGLINAQWVVHRKSVPPIVFADAMQEMKGIIPDYVIEKLHKIIEMKAQGKEKETIENIEILDDFIEHFLEDTNPPLDKSYPPLDVLNEELQRIVLSCKGL